MTIAGVIAALGSISTIIGGIVYIFQYSTWSLKKTDAQKAEDLSQKIKQEQEEAKETGRPV